MSKLTQKDAYELFHEGVLALSKAEQVGMRIDLNYLHKEKKRITFKVKHLERELHQTKLYKDWEKYFGAKININSSLQLRDILYNKYKLKPINTTAAGFGKTDDETLSQIDVLGLDLILKIRKLQKIRDTYLENFEREQVDGYIHPFFNLHNVITFRSSSDRPNFQNIPKRDKEAMKAVRRAIYARPGHLLMEADFSKLEVSIAACYHKDPTMLKYLTSEHNDMHRDLAAQLFKIDDFDRHIPEYGYLRSAAKNGFVFPQFYGDYYVGCADSLAKWTKLPHSRFSGKEGVTLPNGIPISSHLINQGIKNYNQFENHIKQVEDDFWNRRFKVYQQWKDRWLAAYQRKGYFDSLTGFRYRGIYRRNQVINYPVQGAAFHCLLWSFIQMDKWLFENNMDTKLIGQIHDAMVLDVNPNELQKVYQKIREITTQQLPATWDWIIVPLDISFEITDVDKPWADKYEYEV